MSTNKNPIHMRLWTFAWRYSRERRMGLSRVAALRAAWAWITTPFKIANGSITVGGLTIRADGVATIDRSIIVGERVKDARPHGVGPTE